MKECRISLQKVNLYYSSVAFKERSLKSLLAGLLQWQRKKTLVHDIHALKDICLEIRAGERVGLLGHNGAGKTTFLKMVAGLYPVASGTRIVEGQVRALFDLSLGFEPDATGRENILYRGLLLGLSPRFMRQISDEIIAFADVGEFIDYPLKTYSAGMQVRLAFAISTIVGGDVLLLDEVIGAGDMNFMAKAQKRIFDLVGQSQIVILASHDLAAIQAICQRGIVFRLGSIVFDGQIEDAVSAYKKTMGCKND